jgi:outer membrane protein
MKLSLKRKFERKKVSKDQETGQQEMNHKKRKRGRLVSLRHVFTFIFCLAVASSSPSAQEPMTLQDCVSLARENSRKLLQQRTSIEQSRLGVTSAYSSYYPGINFSSSYRINESSVRQQIGSYSGSIGLSNSLYQGGSIRAGVKIAKAKVAIAEEDYRQVEDEVILSVKEAFFNILLKQEQIALTEDVLKRRNEDLVLIRLKYDAGRESSPAVKEAEASLLQAEYNKKQAQEELNLARIELNLLLGRPRRTEISLTHEDQSVEFPALDSLIAEANHLRPDIRAEKVNTDVLEAQVTQAKSDYYPRISVSSSYGWQGRGLSVQEGDWSVGFSLSLPIFEGFSTKVKVQEANLALSQQDIRLRELEQEIEQEIEQAYSNWELAGRTIEVNDKTLQAKREMYQLTKLQYEQGLTSYFILQQKESDLSSAESRQINALYNLRVSTARLEKVWGRSS